MALNPAALQAKMQQTIYNGLKAQFSSATGKGQNYTPEADAQWLKMATAISLIAADIVMEIVTDAQVNPGIPTPAGGPTVAPGQIT